MTAHVTQLFTLLLGQGDTSRLAEAVSRAEEQMKAADETDLWFFWKGQSALLLGDQAQAASYLSKISDNDRAETLNLLITRAVAEKSGDPSALIAALEQRFARTGDPLHLFDLCESYYANQRWEAIANRATALVDGVSTAPALRLALEAAHRSGNYDLCLKLLEGRDLLFFDGKLPVDLRRLRVDALCKQGQPDRAVIDAEALARETGDSRDIMTVVAARLQCADPKGAVVAARHLLDRDDVTAESHLRLAYSLQIEDKPAAVAHLDRALAKPNDSPQFLAAAMGLVFRLNREDKLAALQPALVKAATAGGPIQLAGPDRLMEVLRANSEQRENAEKLYSVGRIPLHLAVEVVGGTFAQIYDSRFHPTDDSLWPPAAPLYFLHGGRAAAPKPHSITRLYVDTSSLLLADELDILDAVEKTFAPLYLPHSVVPALYRQMDEAQAHQPTKLEEAHIIATLFRKKLLHTSAPPPAQQEPDSLNRPSAAWLALNAAARTAAGFVVDYLPTTVGFPPTPAALSEEESNSVVGISSVLHSLERDAKLTVAQSNTARQKLFSFAAGPSREIPEGASLYLRGNIVEVLAGAGILEDAGRHFRIFIEQDERERIEALLVQETKNSRLRARLHTLLDRIQRGLGKVWILLPEAKLAESFSGRLETQCLGELMTAVEPVVGAYVWIDDRFLNAFATCGKSPIITLVDVLRELRSRDQIDAVGFAARLHRIRGANLRYLPLNSDDIIHHLSNAGIKNRDVVETPELTILRQYTAACMSERGRLQFPPVTEGLPNPEGEIALLPTHLEATREALSKLWSRVTTENVSEIEPKADWVLHGLWCDAAALSWIVGNRSDVPNALHGSALAQLYVHGLGLKGTRRQNDPSKESPRALYFKWLATRLGHDHESIVAAARHLNDIFTHEKWPRFNEDQNLVNALLGDFLHDLPRPLYLALKLPKTILQRFGIEFVDAINVEGHSFDGAVFWPAAERAMSGKRATVQTRDTDAVFTLKVSHHENRPVIELTQEGGEGRFSLSDPAFALLDKDRHKRRAVVMAHREWFDCERLTFEKEAGRIADNPAPRDRFRKLELWKQRSAAHYYANLIRKRNERKDVALSDFTPPSVHGLLSHLRLRESSDGKTVAQLLAPAANALLAEVGFAQTFRRLASLPIITPPAVLAAFAGLPPDRREAWSNAAVHEFLSPISRVHLIALLAQTDPRRAVDLIEQIPTELGDKSCEAFQLVHFWTLARIEEVPEVTHWPTKLRLAISWLHASRLFDILIRISPIESVAEFFVHAIRPTSHDVFRSDRDLDTDAAHPRQVRFRSLYVHGLTSLLSPTSFSPEENARIAVVLRKLCFVAAENNALPHPDVMLPADWLRNSIGSFFHGDRAALLRPWLGDDALTLSTEFVTALLKGSFGYLHESVTQSPEHWRILSTVIGVVPPPSALRPEAASLLTDSRLPDLVDLDYDTRKAALFFLGNQAAYFPEARREFGTRLVAIASRLETTKIAAPQLRDNATLIMECAHALAIAEPTPRDAGREFTRLMLAIIGAWPASLGEFWSILRGLTTRLAPSVAVELWPLVFELRKKGPAPNPRFVEAKVEKDTEPKSAGE